MPGSIFKGVFLFFALFVGIAILRGFVPYAYYGIGSGMGWFMNLFMSNILWIFLIFCVAYGFSSRHKRRAWKTDEADDLDLINDKLEDLHRRVAEIQREHKTDRNQDSSINGRLDEICERIVALEKVVSDRRYRLDEEFRKL